MTNTERYHHYPLVPFTVGLFTKNFKCRLEIENKKSINFLDITTSPSDDKRTFKIFHKPTHIDVTIHNTSIYPKTHKLAACMSMIHKLVNVPMNDTNFYTESNRIITITYNNGFKTHR